MDNNKLKVLCDIGYKIKKTCKTCKHSVLSADGWGTCSILVYKHKKHNRILNLSINESGYCHQYNANESKISLLHGFSEFFED